MNDAETITHHSPKPKKGGKPFTRIENALLQDRRLSLRARGLLALVLSQPPHWTWAADRIAKKHTTDGSDSVRGALRELQVCGYAELKKVIVDRGRIENRWYFNESPSAKKPEAVNGGSPPSAILPGAGQPGAGQVALYETTTFKTTTSETNRKDGKEETSLPAGPGSVRGLVSIKAPKVGTVQNPRPLPKAVAEVIVFATTRCIPAEQATAFFHYQNACGWQMNGRPLVDWQKALPAWAKTDRSRFVKRDGMDNKAFWAMVDEEGFSHETVNDWIDLMKKQDWKLKNPRTGRMEPVQDYRALISAFVVSDLNQTLEEKGIR